MKCTLVIPTYKREKALQKALDSVLGSSRIPDEIIIIDDASLPSRFIHNWVKKTASKNSRLRYYKKEHTKNRRGLSESKNVAMGLASHDIIFYIDDDVVLDSNYIAEMMNIWEANTDSALFAVGGKIANNRMRGLLEMKIYNPFFGLSSTYAWDITDVGFQVWNDASQEIQKGFYVHGGVSSYRKSVIKKYPFMVFSGGRTGLEDVEQMLRAKKDGWYCIYNPKAFLYHHHSVSGRESEFNAGKKESKNRKEIFKIHCDNGLHYTMWFIWSTIGWALRKIMVARFSYVSGLMLGLFSR